MNSSVNLGETLSGTVRIRMPSVRDHPLSYSGSLAVLIPFLPKRNEDFTDGKSISLRFCVWLPSSIGIS